MVQSFGEELADRPAKTWSSRCAARVDFAPKGFEHLRFSPTYQRARRLRSEGARPGIAACFDGRDPARVTCERAVPLSRCRRCTAHRLWLVGGAGGDGTECREDLRCLKRKAHKVWRLAKPGHNVFPVLSSVHARAAAER